jgi:type II secretory pathway component GspD/PulD (secretin)
MIVSPQTSAIDPNLSVPISSGIGGTITAPVIDIRSADTVVITPDAQTVVIGGMMQSTKAATDNKIPFLGDLPLLGNLFKRKVRSAGKSELLIFLTPHVVRSPTQMAAMSDREKSQSELMPKSFSEQELDRFLEKVPAKKQP